MNKLFLLFDDNGIFTEIYSAQEDPHAEGTYIVNPDRSTLVPLPPLAANETGQFVKGAWVIIPDYRGQIQYFTDGTESIVTVAGALATGYSLTPPSPPIIVVPDIAGFITAIKVGVGGIVAANSLAQTYPLFFPAIQSSDWEDVATLISDAKSKNIISQAQYQTIKTAAAANNVPLTLS